MINTEGLPMKVRIRFFLFTLLATVIWYAAAEGYISSQRNIVYQCVFSSVDVTKGYIFEELSSGYRLDEINENCAKRQGKGYSGKAGVIRSDNGLRVNFFGLPFWEQVLLVPSLITGGLDYTYRSD